ncbi:MAG: hypothetical protein MI802_18315 [Desulfobacterales bacterium]|nr:hypothetical protein [Desulfobacterales bacterium]
MRRIFIFAILTVLFAWPYGLYASPQTITISTFEEDTAVVRVSELLKKAYRRIGVEMTLARLPANRALIEANTGVLAEGELIRIGGLTRKFPNLIQVPVMIADFKISVFSKNIDFKVDGWQSLKPYHIAFKRGFKGMEKHAGNLNVTRVQSSETAMEILDLERVDIIVLPFLDGLVLRKKLNLPGIKILEPPLEQVQLYHYVHNSRKDTADKLGSVLKEMDAAGDIKRFWQKIETGLSGFDG